MNINTPKDNRTVTGSLLILPEFLLIQTILWGFGLHLFYYFLDIILVILTRLTGSNLFYRLFFGPPLYYLWPLLDWPQVMAVALILTVIRFFLRRTAVTLSGDVIVIHRLCHTDRLPLSNFLRPETKEAFIRIRYIGWVFRRRYLIFRDEAGKECKYRLYEFSAENLDRVMQLITRVNPTEHLDETLKTSIIMDSFRDIFEISIDPRQILRRERLFLLITGGCALFIGSLFSYILYLMFHITAPYNPTLLLFLALGSFCLAVISVFWLCYALWQLLYSTFSIKSCPRRIAFGNGMLRIDDTIYSINRIRRILMTSPAQKPHFWAHYRIKISTLDGSPAYTCRPGSAVSFDFAVWQRICRGMQELLVSCPDKLIYK